MIIKKAFILAGGEGKRLRPYTFVIPKPLMPIGEKPIIGLVLERLIKHGFQEIIVSIGYMGDMVINIINSLNLPINVSFAREDFPLGTAGSISLVDNLSNDILVMNGDLITNLNLSNIYNYHKKNNAMATIGVVTREIKVDFGVIKVDSKNNFEDYIEKPIYKFNVSMGINVFSPQIKNYIKKNEYLDIPTLIKRLFANKEKIVCYKENCKWLDIGREYDYKLALEEFDKNRQEYL